MASSSRGERNKTVRIDRETTSEAIFAYFDEIGSDNESDIENVLNDSDTEFVSEEVLPEGDNDNNNILVPEATVHMVVPENRTTEPLRNNNNK